ncbi:MAG: helix-turn-helix domain-containing protein [Solobacterium sp.]|nr:helix-turn-helix domain-containing protein [Solobacterium sp.]MBR0478530.1 helix-turn-helix domain-containing protein [Solobacterium sp.]
METGKKIRRRRKELNMTQEELAGAVYVTPQAISQWENGRTLPDIYKIPLIAEALKMNKAELIDGGMEIHPSWITRDPFYSMDNMRRKLKAFALADGLPETDRAIGYAEEKHTGQFRKTSTYSPEKAPYIVHPFIMACHAHALGIHDDTVLAVILLHDVCEDCGVRPDELPFSAEVREAVRLLTKQSGTDPAEYFKGIRGNSTASIVKAFDRCSNLSTMMLSFTIEDIIEYVEETETYILPLLDHIKKEYPQYYDAVFVLKYQMLSMLESVKAAVVRL